MSAKEYLRSYRQMGLQIDSLHEQIRQVEEQRGAISITMDGQPHGSGKTSDPTGRQAAKLADELTSLQDQLEELEYHYWIRRRNLVMQILGLDDALQGRVLMLRYVECMTWEEIAIELSYSYMHVCRIHGYALQAFGKKYQDVIECYTV